MTKPKNCPTCGREIRVKHRRKVGLWRPDTPIDELPVYFSPTIITKLAWHDIYVAGDAYLVPARKLVQMGAMTQRACLRIARGLNGGCSCGIIDDWIARHQMAEALANPGDDA